MNEQSKEAIVLKYYGENDWGQPIYQVGDKESFLVDLGMGRLEEPDFHWCSPKNDPYGEPDYPFVMKEGIEVVIQGPEEPEKSREEKKFIIAKMMAANEYQEGKTSVEWLDRASGIHDLELTKELLTELKEHPMELVFDSGIGWMGKEQEEAMAVLSPYGLDSSDNRFRYQMLGRMQRDCNYYLGNGNHYAGHLWAKDEKEQIEIMKALYHSFHDWEKPEWLSMEDILGYEKEMCPDLPERFIKISAGMTEEYEVIQTTAPDEVIIEQLKENNRLSEEGILIENPYEVIEAHGFSVECIGCQDDDELLDEIEIDAEFDSYDYEPELKDSLDAKIQSATKTCEEMSKNKGSKVVGKEMEL